MMTYEIEKWNTKTRKLVGIYGGGYTADDVKAYVKVYKD